MQKRIFVKEGINKTENAFQPKDDKCYCQNRQKIDKKNYDLTVKNPNIIHDETIKTKDIFKNLNLINKNENHNQSVVSKLFEKYEKTFNDNKKHWKEVKISDVAHVEGGTGFPKKYQGLLNDIFKKKILAEYSQKVFKVASSSVLPLPTVALLFSVVISVPLLPSP